MSEIYLTLKELDQFFKDEGDGLYTYLDILCKNQDEAEDLLQSVFLKFIEQVKKERILKKTARNYIKVMARNQFNEKFRKDRGELALADAENIPADEKKVEMEATSRAIRLALIELITSPELPEDIAGILEMRFIEGADIEEICRRITKSRATVYRMMEKGMKYLAHSFTAAGFAIKELKD